MKRKDIPVQKSFDVIRAERAVIRAAKEWNNKRHASGWTFIGADKVGKAVDSLLKLEKKS